MNIETFGGLTYDGTHRLMCMNTLFIFGGSVWEILGRVVLLGEVWYGLFGRCVWLEYTLRVQKPLPFTESLPLPAGCGSGYI